MLVGMVSLQMGSALGGANYRRTGVNANFHLLDIVSHCSTYSIIEYKMFDERLAQVQLPLKSAGFFCLNKDYRIYYT